MTERVALLPRFISRIKWNLFISSLLNKNVNHFYYCFIFFISYVSAFYSSVSLLWILKLQPIAKAGSKMTTQLILYFL